MERISELTDHADFLIRFGFLGVGISMIFILTPFVHKLINIRAVTISTLSIGILFLLLFAATDFIKNIFPGILPQSFSVLQGSIQGVPTNIALSIKSDSLDEDEDRPFMRWENDKTKKDTKTYPFIFLTEQAPRCITISMEKTSIDPEDGDSIAKIFNIHIPPQAIWTSGALLVARHVDQDGHSRINYSIKSKNIRADILYHADPAKDDEASCSQSASATIPAFKLISTAFAAEFNLSVEEIASQLRHTDAIVRRDMRIELSRQGAGVFDALSSLLLTSEYRLQIGAISAIAAMPLEVRATLPAATIASARQLLSHPDRTMRDTALRALRPTAWCYQEIDHSKPDDRRYLVQCYFEPRMCESVRGPNLRPEVRQTSCHTVNLADLDWKYAFPGFNNGWYQFSPRQIGKPFPDDF